MNVRIENLDCLTHSAGLSAGAIYTYVESKEALFHLVLLPLLGDVPDSTNGLPLATPPFTDTLALMDRQLRAYGSAPALRAARWLLRSAGRRAACHRDDHLVRRQRAHYLQRPTATRQ